MLVPKLIMAVKTLIPIDEVKTGGREPPLLEGNYRSIHLGPMKTDVVTLKTVQQVKACEALEALDELLESGMPIVTPHLSEVLSFCLEVSQGMGMAFVTCSSNFLVSDSHQSLAGG